MIRPRHPNSTSATKFSDITQGHPSHRKVKFEAFCNGLRLERLSIFVERFFCKGCLNVEEPLFTVETYV
ncbi:hypothetical protein AAHA92_08351 [Salvia divinorum]|uniref:Uncharacterized protein n=1 Tax=Salvia divinorum TaxID=28513 RepID=A0ABD1HMZ4_SALDI